MMWDQVMLRVIEMINADPVLAEIYHGTLQQAGTAAQAVPSIEWILITDIEDELWAPCVIQFDLWNRVAADCRRGEFRLRSMFHSNLQLIIGGDLQIWSQYTDGSMLATPDRSNIIGRALRFKFTPLRRQYALPGVGSA